MTNQLTLFWQDIADELKHPDIVWQIIALTVAILLTKLVEGIIRGHASAGISAEHGRAWQLGQGSLKRVVFPLIALWLSNTFEARLNRAPNMDSSLRMVFVRLSRAFMALIAVLIALPLVGIDLTTLSVFGGALGVGLGFGLQKIASNYVSGFILLLDHSIRIGDMISVGSDRGQVTRITTRFTVLRTLTGAEILMPNELLISSVVRNDSYTDRQVRVAIPVQVSYDSDLELTIRLLNDAARTHPRVLAEPAPRVLLIEFAESGINLELGCWITDPENGLGALRSDINLTIWQRFKEHHINIPFPQREIRILGEHHV